MELIAGVLAVEADEEALADAAGVGRGLEARVDRRGGMVAGWDRAGGMWREGGPAARGEGGEATIRFYADEVGGEVRVYREDV